MAQITIDTNVIISMLLGVFAIIGVVALLMFAASCLWHQDAQTYTVTTAATPVVSTPAYPSVLTFTVLSTTTSNGRYQVTTTSGNILYFTDYSVWNRMYPRSTYTATLVGMENGAYQVGTVTLLSGSTGYYGNYYDDDYYGGTFGYQNTRYVSVRQDLPTYWHYQNKYYQCDKTACDPMIYKQIIGERINEGRPPRPVRVS